MDVSLDDTIESSNWIYAGSQQRQEYISECSPSYNAEKAGFNFTSTISTKIKYSIRFRPLQESDRDEIKKLHEELFPVEYTDQFYDTVVQNITMFGSKPLFSCIATVTKEEENDEEQMLDSSVMNTNGQQYVYEAWDRLADYVGIKKMNTTGLYEKWNVTETVTQDHLPSSCRQVLQGDSIVGCVVGTFIDVTTAGKEVVEQLVLNPYKHTKMFYIMTLGSTKSFRGRGLGSKLMIECMNIIEQVPDCGVIYLHVITYNTTAIRFYERLGYYRIQEIKDYYTIENEKFDCYLYAKFINGKCIIGESIEH